MKQVEKDRQVELVGLADARRRHALARVALDGPKLKLLPLLVCMGAQRIAARSFGLAGGPVKVE